MSKRHPVHISQTLGPLRVEFLRKPGFLGTVDWFQSLPPHSLAWKHFDLPIETLPAGLDGFRILHLSDFHFKRCWPAVYDQFIARIRQNPPDLLLITGDLVDSKRNPLPAVPQVRRLFDGLAARHGCFAIIGNHDDYEVAYELRESGIHFLDGRRHVVPVGDHALELIGLPGARRYELEAEMVGRLPARSAGLPRIVLSHYPDHHRRAPALDADLFLAGHTHGGQICLPGGVPLMWHDTLPRRLSSGVHRVNNTWLAVSRGMGVSEVAVRIFSPPEVLELRLCRGEPRVRPPSAG